MDSIYRILGGVVVIAANTGGAWSRIGVVTTTMLWINGQVSAVQTMKVICWKILPVSYICLDHVKSLCGTT